MSAKLFLFDLDMTVISTGGAGIRALDHAFAELYQIPESMKDIRPDGKTDPAIVREMIQFHLHREPQPGEIDTICEMYVARLPTEVAQGDGYKVLPGVPELLDALAQRPDVWVGLGTGNLEGGAIAKLAPSGLMRYFKFGGYSTDAELRPDVLRAAVRRGEKLAGGPVPPHDVFVIGDNFRDVDAGKAIGAVTVAVATGNMTVEQLASHSPDYALSNLSDTQNVMEIFFGVPERRR